MLISKMKLFFKSVFIGMGQIFLCRNIITGILFTIGILIGNLWCGLAAIVAAIVGTGTAYLLKYEVNEIEEGLYGFSAALTGVVLIFLFESTFLIWTLVVAGAIHASLLQHYFIQRNIPVYTFPFIVTTWVIYFLVSKFGWAQLNLHETISFKSQATIVLAGTNGFGQVIFQEYFISGILFFIAVFISSPVAACSGLIASFAGGVVAFMLGYSLNDITSGTFGFNAVLSAIAFAGNKWSDIVWILIAVVITLLIHFVLIFTQCLNEVGGVFTFPFVAGCWVTLSLKYGISKSKKINWLKKL